MLAECSFESLSGLADRTTRFSFVERTDRSDAGDSGREHLVRISFIDSAESDHRKRSDTFAYVSKLVESGGSSFSRRLEYRSEE
jgi:hypothetical protein